MRPATVLNVGTGKATSINTMTKKLLRLLGARNLQRVHANPKPRKIDTGPVLVASLETTMQGFERPGAKSERHLYYCGLCARGNSFLKNRFLLERSETE